MVLASTVTQEDSSIRVNIRGFIREAGAGDFLATAFVFHQKRHRSHHRASPDTEVAVSKGTRPVCLKA